MYKIPAITSLLPTSIPVMVCKRTAAVDGLTKNGASTCEAACPVWVCALETSPRVPEDRAGKAEIVNAVVILNVTLYEM